MKTSKIRPQISAGTRHLLPIMVLGLIALTTAAHAESPVIRTAVSKLPKNKVITTINFEEADSSGIAVDPNDQYVYVGSNLGVQVVNISTNSLVATIQLPLGLGAGSLAVSPDGGTLYAESDGFNSVVVIDTATLSVVGTLGINGNLYDYMTLSPDGTTLYLIDVETASLSAFNSSSGVILWTANLGNFPEPAYTGEGLASSPDGSYLYVLNEGVSGKKTQTGYVSVVQSSTGAVILPQLKFQKGRVPVSLVMSPDGSTLYAGEGGCFDVQLIDTASNTRTKQIVIDNVGMQVDALAVTPNGKFLYVSTTTNGDGDVYMVDLAKNKVVGPPIPVGDAPDSIAIDPTGTYCYVSNELDGTLTVIDISTK